MVALFIYISFRFGVDSYLRVNKNSKTYIRKSKKGYLNYWIYKKINEDIYLVFFDEEYQIPFGQTSQNIPMIIQDGVSIGYTAAKTLLKMIHTPTKIESKHIPVKYINWD